MSNPDPDLPQASLPRRRLLALATLVEGGMLAAAITIAWITGIRLWNATDATLHAAALAAALTLPLLIGLAVSVHASSPFFTRIRRDLQFVLPLFRNATVLDLLLISILAGLGEEALFRGVLQPLAAGVLTPIPALIAVSILFGFVHFISLPYALFATAMGLYLGAIQLHTENLLIPIAIHALYDFAALLYLLRLAPATNRP